MELEDHMVGYVTTGHGCCCWMVVKPCRKADNCDYCRDVWKRGLEYQFYLRYRASGVIVRYPILWTLGTNYDADGDGRRLLREHWNSFRQWMDKNTDWKPIFRVVETGAKGGKLHIHFISIDYIEHELVTSIWRGCTNLKANINFMRFDHLDLNRPLQYMLKYLSKGISLYSWMGPFYNVDIKKRKHLICIHGNKYEYIRLLEEDWRNESYYIR